MSDDARRFFDAVARRYDRVYALSGAASRERLARVLREIQGRPRVLVLGIGTGRELPALLDAGHAVTGIDVSPEMVAICNKRARTAPVALADFWAPLPFADSSFDAALALHGTIAHPPGGLAGAEASLARLSEEIARVLAPPSGVLVAEVPAGEALARIAADDGDVAVVATGARSFRHEDRVAGVSIEGVALDAAAWRRALGPSLDARVEPLGAAEHLIVATPRGW